MAWITTDNVPAEAWRHLLEYANHELAVEAIIKKHGEPKKNSLANYNKQAKQIRASILQAKEYFDAAESSSLITSPNHLYYGMISLGSAIMLLLGTGDKALDKLRQDKKNNNHGLDFTTSVNAASCQKGFNILTKSFTAVRNNGFFLQWYSTLPQVIPSYGEVISQNAQGGKWGRIDRVKVGEDHNLSSEKIVGYKTSILETLKYLPDLNSSLRNYEVTVPSSRMDFKVNKFNDSPQNSFEWRIHGAGSKEELELILDHFSVPEDKNDKLIRNVSSDGSSCIVKLMHEEEFHFSYPSYRETINNEKIIYATSQLNRHEIVDAYLSAYGLSMLSRYFPDIWVGCLESHCKAAKLIERLLFILIQKAPVMTLALMRSDDFVISTHRPPWHGGI